ncbi:hypothetical protein CKO41_02490 [Thiococcus pfennigii]|nr:hypothetical protein [Thiococcus pfennigii]MBK1730689.1 hypothetical protein [Thiococcus pfennigii]
MGAIDEAALAMIRRCTDCGDETMAPEPGGLRCRRCGHRYRFDANGVLVALPSTPGLGLPAFYRSRFYARWLRAWDDMVAKGWVIYERPLYRFFSLSGHRRIRAALEALGPPDGPVVDLGCGDGRLLGLLGPRSAIGVDLNAAFLARLKARAPAALAVQADFNNLPFATGSLSCCTSAHVLEHLYFLAEGLEEVHRVLAADGRFLFTIPTEGGVGWELGRRLVTGPRLRRDYRLDVQDVMAIEHINDARRVLRLARLYFRLDRPAYAPFPFVPLRSLNSSITVAAAPLPVDHELRAAA